MGRVHDATSDPSEYPPRRWPCTSNSTAGSLDRKLTALAAMASQTAELMATIDPELYAMQVAEEAFIDATTLVG